MAAINKLSVLEIKGARGPVKLSDGGGLYLQINASDARRWIFRYKIQGKSTEMGLGGYPTVSLADARQKAAGYRQMLAENIDPKRARDVERERQVEEARTQEYAAEQVMTFKACAETYIDDHKYAWKNAKHASQWRNTLRDYVYPVFGTKAVDAIDTPMVVAALRPIWHTKTETATRVRQRIENILDWAKVSGYRSQENPARWRGHLDHLLPKPEKIKAAKHHAALPYDEISSFIAELVKRKSISSQAMLFTILTACRTGEVIGATWNEIDLDNRIWIIPAERMKAKKEHRVPLSDAAMDIVNKLPRIANNDHLFPGQSRGKSISNMTMLMLLKKPTEDSGLNRPDLTIHGFRSTFRDWSGETTPFPREVIEHALAHQLRDKAEAAYARGDLLIKRRKLMQAWADYCMAAQRQGVEDKDDT